MTRLVALQHSDPAAMLRGLDAVWAAGEAALPLDPRAPDPHTARLVERLAPAELRDDSGSHRMADGRPVPDGTALVVTTSGSTGAPQGVVLSHDALAASTSRSRTRLDAADGVPWLGVLPLHHVAGISVVLRSRAAGREPVLHRRDGAHALDAAEPAWVSLVPAQLGRLLDTGADLARHHGVLLGGAAAPDELLARAAAAGVHVVTSYGATETCGGCVYDGVPLDDVEVRTDRTGRIQLRTPTMATGVRRSSGQTVPLVDEDGWWTTADLGSFDEGRLEVHGRADDVVVSGGENVPLAGVRTALAGIGGVVGGVLASDVVGLPDDRWGTAVTAVVVPVARRPTLQEVRSALTGLLPRAHVPTALVIAPELPTTALGKVTSHSVQEAIRTGRADLTRHRPPASDPASSPGDATDDTQP